MPVTPTAIAVLLASTVLVAAVAALSVLTVALLWSVKQIQPIGQIRSKVSELEAMVDNFEAQVAKIRTQKAGRTSAAKRREEESNPELAGLDEETARLFQGLEN